MNFLNGEKAFREILEIWDVVWLLQLISVLGMLIEIAML
jgi:hypothetical protein